MIHAKPHGFPRSVFAYWEAGAFETLKRALRLMKAYKRKGISSCKDSAYFKPEEFDREKPDFVRVWGDVGVSAGDGLDFAAKLMDRPMVELLAFVGPTTEFYPMLMPKEQFEAEFEVD